MQDAAQTSWLDEYETPKDAARAIIGLSRTLIVEKGHARFVFDETELVKRILALNTRE